ncbi:hypothetical protein PG999_014546 [Apiospora kogelbergensis]|uniref:Uncharacterized protein n=1 Tax=Apiospora kogelbergensis TaxID=1337665 RepID=A0AAW0Q3K3_9PEZI
MTTWKHAVFLILLMLLLARRYEPQQHGYCGPRQRRCMTDAEDFGGGGVARTPVRLPEECNESRSCIPALSSAFGTAVDDGADFAAAYRGDLYDDREHSRG